MMPTNKQTNPDKTNLISRGNNFQSEEKNNFTIVLTYAALT